MTVSDLELRLLIYAMHPSIVKLLKESDFEIIDCDTKKVLRPTPRGWRAIHLDLRAPNGQLLEFQIVPDEINTVAKAGDHAGYAQWRDN